MITVPRAPAGAGNVVIDAALWTEIASVLERMQNINVAAPLQMHNSPGGGVTISLDDHPIYIKVMSSSRDGSNWRWTYTVRRVIRGATGFGAWSETSSNLNAFNTLEQMNGASGVMGNGIDTANLSGTGLEIQPAPAGAIFEAKFQFDALVFQYANGVDGPCEEE